jgi:hypothetical protein
LISDFSLAVHYLEWSDISWSQFSFNLEPVGASHRGNLKVYEIINFEQNVSPFIRIALFVVTERLLDFLKSSRSVSRHPLALLDQILDSLQFDSRTAMFYTVVHIVPQMVPFRY